MNIKTFNEKYIQEKFNIDLKFFHEFLYYRKTLLLFFIFA